MPREHAATPPPAAPAPPRRLSLEHKLPLALTGLLVIVLATSLLLTYATLTRTAEGETRRHLVSAAREVARTIGASTAAIAGRGRAVAADPAVRRVLAGDSADARVVRAARAALAGALAPADSGLAVELWDAAGRPLLGVVGPGGPPRVAREHHAAAGAWLAAPDTGFRVGPMFADGRGAYFWTAAPVTDDRGTPRGWVARERRVYGAREAIESLRDLIGEEVMMVLRNHDAPAPRTVWVQAPGHPIPAPARRDSGDDGPVDTWAGGGEALAAEAAIPGSPWVIVLETPRDLVLARAHRALERLAALSLALTFVGAALSWSISRRVTRPLGALTAAAEKVARGEYGGRARRPHETGESPLAWAGDEIDRLSASFDVMANEVAATRRELERRVESARSAAEALARANARLRASTAEAEGARAEAERANRAKGDFLAVMSHELRTPLNAIGGYADLLEMGLYGPLTDAQRDALARIARSQAHLLALINDVLSFAKIDAGQVRYEVEDVPMDETLAALEALVAPQVRAKSLALEYRPCDPALTARADREKLRQVVLNLLGNAIKFTPEGGRVELACEADGGAVRVRVRDTGVGIAPDRRAQIFEPFVQGERALNRPNDGVGLGLAISRDLARGMGGDLTVESEVGAGSTFTLALPRRAGVAAGAGGYADARDAPNAAAAVGE